MSYEVKIPRERIAVLIGTKGETKKLVEKKTNTKLKIDSEEGDVIIESKENIDAYNAQDVIKAIGRGFNPEIAISLTKESKCLEIIDMDDYAKTKNHLARIKARIIGREGKVRKFIEHVTECYMCIYGKTVSIIGEVENIAIAKKTVQDILSGAPHGPVFKWAEQKMKQLIKEQLE